MASPLRFPLLLALVASAASAQVVSDPNQIVGDVRFTNVDPTILGYLASDGGFQGANATAVHGHGSLSSGYTSLDVASRTLATYEISLQADAAGADYDISIKACVKLDATGTCDDYDFPSAQADPLYPEPAPDVRRDVTDCACLVRIHAVTPEHRPTLMPAGNVQAVFDGRVFMGRLRAGRDVEYFLIAGDDLDRSLDFDYSVTDAGGNPVGYRSTETVHAACDAIVDVDLVVRVPGSSGLGAIEGQFDILGEDELDIRWPDALSFVKAWRNVDPEPRVYPFLRSPSSGHFLLESLVPSTEASPPAPYTVSAATAFRDGFEIEFFQFTGHSVLVGDGERVDLADTFVVDPGSIRGNIVVAGPGDSPARPSALRFVSRMFVAPGAHDFNALDLLNQSRVQAERTPGTPGLGALATVGFLGDFDDRNDAFVGSYDVVAGGGNRGAADWNLRSFMLTVYGGDRSREDGFVQSSVTVYSPLHPTHHVSPGSVGVEDVGYCTSDVEIDFEATSGTFYEPVINGSGNFAGVDFTGAAADYTAYVGGATGIPTLRTEADSHGRVNMLLPEGRYDLRPSIRTVNPGGGTTLTRLPDVEDLDVGCRSTLRLYRTLIVHVSASLPPCSAAGTVPVSGEVRGGATVASLSWRAGEGAPVTICAPCGPSPTFAFDAPLSAGDTAVVVTAVDVEGHEASTTVTTRSSPEPSALDLDPLARPLTVRRGSGDGVVLDWEVTHFDSYAVHRGTLASLHSAHRFDHVRVSDCDLAEATFTAEAPGSCYFLVTANCGHGTGSFGRDSFGAERPPSPDPCN